MNDRCIYISFVILSKNDFDVKSCPKKEDYWQAGYLDYDTEIECEIAEYEKSV